LFGDPLLAEISIRSERTTLKLLARLLLLARFALGEHKMRLPRLDEIDDDSGCRSHLESQNRRWDPFPTKLNTATPMMT
jgi:hypothetical protein